MSNQNDFVIENGVLIKYTGDDTDVVVPEGVTIIGNNSFEFCELTSVVIPDGVTATPMGKMSCYSKAFCSYRRSCRTFASRRKSKILCSYW